MRSGIVYTLLTKLLFRYSFLTGKLSIILLLFLYFSLITQNLFSQEQPEYDEISVFIEIPKVGGGEIDAVIKGQQLYLPITDLFDFLKIRNVPDPNMESVTGFFINPDATYSISRKENKITYQEDTYSLVAGDLIRTESNLYLKASYFGKIFGLDCIFNFRSLSVTVNSKLELPLIREMRQEEMRKNLTRLKGTITADTTIGRGYPKFKFGMADWSLNASEEINGKTEVRINTALGAMIAGGEASAVLNYNSGQTFSEKQQYYLWRYVNNDNTAIRQVRAGKVNAQSIATLYNPVVGVQVTNTPTTYRRSFGTYPLSDRTEPGWIVELYVNNVLVDYIKADASGFFTFQVPLVYGNTIVKLRFFGPWGEERSREQNISIPFNFLPVNTMEYTASAGIVEDSTLSRFSRGSANYGVSRNITVGGGVEYVSSVTSGPFMPFINASFRVLNNILISGDYTYGVRTKGNLSYQLPSNIQLELNYTWYDKNQTAINFNYREERKASLSIPLRIRKFSAYNRFSLNQLVMPSSEYSTAEWLFSGSFFGVNTNLTTYGNFINNIAPYYYSNLSLSVRVPGGFTIMPQVQYAYNKNGFITSKIAVEKQMLKHGYLNLSYEQNFQNNIRLGELGFRYDFSFAQTGASVRQSDKTTSFIQYARGSIINDKKTNYVSADNRTNVGKGGIAVLAFIDINANGVKDSGEPKVYGLDLRANGGQIRKSEQDTTIRILGLEPYTNCFIELDQTSIDNISWRLAFNTVNVAVDPNIIKTIEIPVKVIGEATGTVSIKKDGISNGQGRIRLNFYNHSDRLCGRTLTEEDGYFSYLGLTKGKYTVRIDSSQLNKLNMTSEPDSITFEIKSGIEGDIVDGLDFSLTSNLSDSASLPDLIPEKPVTKKDTTVMVVHEVVQELVTISEDSWAIQLGAFKVRSNAEVMRKKLETQLGKKVSIIIEDDYFKVRIDEIKERKEVDEIIAILQKNGITELWLISLKAKKQQLILTDRQDTIRTITESKVSEPNETVGPDIGLQLGVFRNMDSAIALMKQLKARYGNRLKIVFDNGFYKIRLSGNSPVKRTVLEEMKKLGELNKLKFKDIWLDPPVEPAEIEPVVLKKAELVFSRAEVLPNIPRLADPLPVKAVTQNKTYKPVSQPGLTVSIKVGVFYKKSEALKAKRKITSKLKLTVEIVEQWDSYIVFIRGFHSREETFMYYPELAGLGYPGVSIIEEY